MSGQSTDLAGHAAQDARTARMDLAVVILSAVALNVVLIRVVPRFAGPLTALCTVSIATWVMRRRGRDWAGLGLRMPVRARWLPLQMLAVMIGAIAIGALTSLLAGLFLAEPETAGSRFGDLKGNSPLLLMWIAIGWIVGGFCEEMVFRGFLLRYLERAFSGGRAGTVLAVLLQGALFGAVHAYNRGLFGLVTIAAVGITLGGFFLAFRRNLWPVILAHGSVDTLGFLEDFFG